MPIAGAVIGAVGAIGGGIIASSGAKSAANAQARGNAQAIAEQRRQYDQTRSDLMPWQHAGTEALGDQGDLLGLNGAKAQQLAINQLQTSPLYKSLFANGQDTLLANASATGGLRGGNTQGALANFGRDTLSSVIENQLSNLNGVSTIGQNSAAQTGAIGQNSANSISNLLSDTGTANASASLASAGAWTGALQSLAKIGSGLFGGSSPNANLAGSVQQTIANNPSIF